MSGEGEKKSSLPDSLIPLKKDGPQRISGEEGSTRSISPSGGYYNYGRVSPTLPPLLPPIYDVGRLPSLAPLSRGGGERSVSLESERHASRSSSYGPPVVLPSPRPIQFPFQNILQSVRSARAEIIAEYPTLRQEGSWAYQWEEGEAGPSSLLNSRTLPLPVPTRGAWTPRGSDIHQRSTPRRDEFLPERWPGSTRSSLTYLPPLQTDSLRQIGPRTDSRSDLPSHYRLSPYHSHRPSSPRNTLNVAPSNRPGSGFSFSNVRESVRDSQSPPPYARSTIGSEFSSRPSSELGDPTSSNVGFNSGGNSAGFGQISFPYDHRRGQKRRLIDSEAGVRKKKALVACAFCRQRKLRCNSHTPCSNCDKRNLHCVYPEHPRRRGPGKAPKGSKSRKQRKREALPGLPDIDTSRGSSVSQFDNPGGNTSPELRSRFSQETLPVYPGRSSPVYVLMSESSRHAESSTALRPADSEPEDEEEIVPPRARTRKRSSHNTNSGHDGDSGQ